MRKTNWIIAGAVFLCFAILGFQTGGSFFPFRLSPISKAIGDPDQSSILLIRVDSLSVDKPALKSVWALFIHYPQHSVRFLQLYPAENSNGLRDWSRWFSISPDGELAPLFVKAVQSYDFSWDGYFVVDDQGLDRLKTKFGGNLQAVTLSKTKESEQMLTICEKLTSANSSDADHETNPQMAGHYRTDLSMKQFSSGLQMLTQSGSPDCGLIPAK